MVRKINQIHKELKFKRYLGLGFLLALVLFFWQLYRAPIALPFLKPYIIKALNHDDSDYLVTLDSVNLELVKSIKPIKIVANNVAYTNAKESLKIDAPKVSVSFSMQALLKGMIAPSAIEVLSPNIYIFRSYGLSSSQEKSSQKVINQKKIELYIEEFNDFMERFNSKEKIYSESYINSIEITNAKVEIHEVDLGKKIELFDMNYTFYRGASDLKLGFNGFLDNTPIGIELNYTPNNNQLGLDVYASDFVPSSSFGVVFGADINVPLGVRVQTLIDLNKIVDNKDNVVLGFEEAISKVIFEFEGGKGFIKFDGLDDYTYDVSQILLKGDIQGGLDKLEIKDALFDLDGQKIAVGFNAVGMKKLLLEKSYEDINLSIKAKTNNLPFEKLTDLWPKYLSPEGWTWCKESLIRGDAKDVNFQFDFAYDEKIKNIGFETLDGKVAVFDADVDYLTGMPVIKHVYGMASFDNSSINIAIDKGVSDGVSLNGGYVKLLDLNTNDPAIDILLKATSSIKDAVNLISNPPLELDKEIGIDANGIEGFADIELSLKFLLLKNIMAEDVNVNLKAIAEDVVVPNVLQNLTFKSPELNLTLNNTSMQILGDSFIDDTPVKLDWIEDFSQKDYKSKYRLGFDFNKNLKKKFGIENLAVLSPPYIVGRPNVVANITVLKNSETKVDVVFDLSNTVLDFAFLGVVKESGEPATIEANLDFSDDKLKSIPHFSFHKDDFVLGGRADFDSKGRVSKVYIPEIEGEKTLANAIVDINYDKPEPFYDITINGASYNLIKFFNNDNKSYRNYALEDKEQQPEDDWLEQTNNADIHIDVNSLWTIDDMPIKNFVGSAKMRYGVGVEELHITGNFSNTQNSILKVDYEPRGDEHMLDISSSDAGATLKVLGFYDEMREGDLKIEAKRSKNKLMIGHAKIRNFKLYKTPALTRLLTVASLSGLVDMLTGDGMVFSHFDAPFKYQNKILSTNNAKASGSVMVLTADGNFNRKTETLDLKGVVAPLRGLDSLLGKIPLLGDLLKGKDGTIFAANYEIVGEAKDPEVNINPFSALSEESKNNLIGVNINE